MSRFCSVRCLRPCRHRALLVPPVAAVQAPRLGAQRWCAGVEVNTALIALEAPPSSSCSPVTLGSEELSCSRGSWSCWDSRVRGRGRVTEGSRPTDYGLRDRLRHGPLSHIFPPPIEELIKSSMAGSWTGSGLFLAQCALISAFALCLSAVIVSRWGKYSRRERREVRAQERATASSGGVGAA